MNIKTKHTTKVNIYPPGVLRVQLQDQSGEGSAFIPYNVPVRCLTVNEGQGSRLPTLCHLFLEVLGMVSDLYLLVQTTVQGSQTVIQQETGAGCPPRALTHSPSPSRGLGAELAMRPRGWL